MTLPELIEAFEAGTLSKADFIRRANEFHSVLSHYPGVLTRSDVDQIRIDANGVNFHIAHADLWLQCPPGEARVAPVEILNFRSYEKRETQLMLRLLGESEVIFDIGANIGWYSLLFARHFPRATIHAFEPLEYFHAYLKANVEANGLEAVVNIHALGFSNEEGSANIFLEKGNATNASLRNVADANSIASVPVKITEMDRWCAQQNIWPDFIKCDVEGAELLVMQGARKVLSMQHPVVVLETLRKWTRPYGYHPNDLIEFLARLGYDCFAIGSSGPTPIQEVTEATTETNYVFLHPVAHATRTRDLLGADS